MKIAIKLERLDVADDDGVRKIVVPSFRHDVSSVMQVKERLNGELTQECELVDAEDGMYMRSFSGEQLALVDYDADEGRVEIEHRRAVYNWLSEFNGAELEITESMGNYAARDGDGRVVLSTAVSHGSKMYCDRNVLDGHDGHKAKVYANDKWAELECSCGCVLFEVVWP